VKLTEYTEILSSLPTLKYFWFYKKISSRL